MARPPAYPVKKLIAITPEVVKAIEDYRFARRIKTEAETLRRLIEAGLKATEKSSPTSASRPSGKIAHTDQDAVGGASANDKLSSAPRKPTPRARPLAHRCRASKRDPAGCHH